MKSLSFGRTGRRAVEMLLRWSSHTTATKPNEQDFLGDLADIGRNLQKS